ncbi:MAG: hypothetical protein H8F28_08840 [Fibrella sp.]|nr:hypothetical protein [Armatimonadota bacterium]
MSSSTAVKIPTTSYPERVALWEKSIVAFEEKDRTAGVPPAGGIVFVGSSSIVGWKTLATDFPTLPVINRGFGGSEIQDSSYYAGRIILPYNPRTVVFYAGDNDIAAGHTNEQVVGDFQTFARKIHAVLPNTKILFLAIKPSPSRWKLEDRMVASNKAIADWIGTQTNMGYIDIHSPMLGPDGMPRAELYGPDKLHMTSEGYRLWARIVSQYLQ